jgi:hypothetical protein
MAKKITQAQKIRDYAAQRPDAKIADIAHSMGIRYQTVYAVLRPKVKTPKKITITATQAALANRLGISTKEYAKQVAKVTNEKWRPPALVPMPEPKTDNVNHPAHYKVGGIETIDFIEAKNLSYHLGNVIKYVTRADHKGDKYEDLCKARWYLNREIAKLSEETK